MHSSRVYISHDRPLMFGFSLDFTNLYFTNLYISKTIKANEATLTDGVQPQIVSTLR